MKSPAPDAAGVDREQIGHAIEHLAGCFVGKSQQQDIARIYSILQQVGHAVSQGARLARTGAGNDELRTRRRDDGGQLLFVQFGLVINTDRARPYRTLQSVFTRHGGQAKNRSSEAGANLPAEIRLEVNQCRVHHARIIRRLLPFQLVSACFALVGCTVMHSSAGNKADGATNRERQAKIQVLDEKLASAPDDAELLLERARLLIRSGERGRALADSQRAMKLQPSWIHARVQTGECLQDVGRTDEAQKLQVPKDLVRADNGHVAESVLLELAREDKRVDNNPNDPAPLIERAKTLRALHLFNLALADSEAAAALQ